MIGTLAVTDRIRAIPVLAQDTIVYVLSALFAGGTVLFAGLTDYRQWGDMAGCAYLVASLVVGGVYLYSRRRFVAARTIALVRRVAVIGLLIFAVLVPLAIQITLRADNSPGAHAQAEVAVIERAGDRVAHDQQPYLKSPTSAGISPNNDSKRVDSSTFFPYLPGMIPFGMINAIKGPLELTDARVGLSGFTLLVAALALLLSTSSLDRRGRALQFLIVLPTGALPMVTGGDDLPVLALMLVGLVALNRRWPVIGGLALGLAGTLKFTAWPLLLLAVLVVRDRNGNLARWRYAFAAAVVVIPAVALGVAQGPVAFFDNVIGFPLGLSKVHSPAASPLVGVVLTHLFPEARRLITVLLAVIGVTVALAVYRRYRPSTPGQIARYTGFLMALATVLAPATRFGYLIYPVNLVVWSYMVDYMAAPRAAEVQSESSPSSSRRMTKVLVGPLVSPASDALIDPVA